MPEDAWRKKLFFLSPENLPGPSWRPAVDVYRHREGWLLKFDLAGVAPDDVELSVRGRQLTVAGVRRDFTVQEGCRAYSMEISYSRFERSVELPDDLDELEIRSESREGMFLVWIRPRTGR